MISFEQYAKAKLELPKAIEKLEKFLGRKFENSKAREKASMYIEKQGEINKLFHKLDKKVFSKEVHITHEQYMDRNNELLAKLDALEIDYGNLQDLFAVSHNHEQMIQYGHYLRIELNLESKIEELEGTIRTYEKQQLDAEREKNAELGELIVEIEQLRKRTVGY